MNGLTTIEIAEALGITKELALRRLILCGITPIARVGRLGVYSEEALKIVSSHQSKKRGRKPFKDTMITGYPLSALCSKLNISPDEALKRIKKANITPLTTQPLYSLADFNKLNQMINK